MTYKFTELGHIYTINDTPVKSVTTIIKSFGEDFDTTYWAYYKTLEEFLTPEVFKAQKPSKVPELAWIKEMMALHPDHPWDLLVANYIHEKQTFSDITSKEGSSNHSMKEQQVIDVGFMRNPFTLKMMSWKASAVKEKGIKTSLVSNLADLSDGVYTEQMLWYKDLYMGTTDVVFIESIAGIRYFDILDYKRASNIEKDNRFQNMKYPVQNLANSKYNRYSLQLSLYAKCLIDAGFKVRGLALSHSNKLTPCDYMANEVIRIVDYLIEGPQSQELSFDGLDTEQLQLE
jgi:hypothetical protein